MTAAAPAGDRLAERARAIRELTLRAIHHAQTGHPGSSLSMVELLTYLYFAFLRVRPDEPEWPGRDRLVLSKGHGSPSYYATLALRGYFDPAELLTLRRHGTRLHGHPKAGALPGVDVSTGSLGQGLSVAAGLALGFRHQQRDNRVVCVLGDGELQEGQNWEAAMAASAFGLDNLVAVVDRNGLQNDGPTESVMPLGDLAGKWRAFGFQAVEVDGHDLQDLHRGFSEAGTEGGPSVVIAHTVKGRGVSFMEGVTKWHHHPIDDRDLDAALAEVRA